MRGLIEVTVLVALLCWPAQAQLGHSRSYHNEYESCVDANVHGYLSRIIAERLIMYFNAGDMVDASLAECREHFVIYLTAIASDGAVNFAGAESVRTTLRQAMIWYVVEYQLNAPR